ncbi:polysaccharide deacetylase family protein [Legionella jamestowniensis]|uniref:Polysaccharide deacetylase n=1 Tax=Legionella jamestowniensis TaxID=455 RepID=A0A0W0UIS3_9GAMM|nr:polysaccharide deacetylase family protein [Legionella jamestowniensis]KTD07763.1 polysaccharide deacetylase [Legionella jamestowniensis]OCH99496.1 polysaccharide deacetylase [Legionella jamestowniensis]SFL61796.1 Polysaccharide deacetylase [Legionella jamestowniensis DSM 19215]
MLKRHYRYSYSPIIERPTFEWPNYTRLAFYIALNIEHFSFGEGLGATLTPQTRPQPDVLNYAWRDYGNRVGVWYLLELFKQLDLPIALLVNSSAYDYCPQVIEAFRARGDEIVAHGRTNSEQQGILNQPEEKALIREVTELITRKEKQAPKGWLGPWISESVNTPDLLYEEGYEYLLDWCHDDQPTWLETAHGRILSIPYSQEVNDIPAIIPNRASASEFAEMIMDNFEEMLEQSKLRPLVFGLSLHPYIIGQPFRLRHLRRALTHIMKSAQEIWITTPGAIATYYKQLFK